MRVSPAAPVTTDLVLGNELQSATQARKDFFTYVDGRRLALVRVLRIFSGILMRSPDVDDGYSRCDNLLH